MNKSKNSLKNKIKVYIGSDHAGFPMKEGILASKELCSFIEFVDVGTYSMDSVDYPDFAQKIGESVLKNPSSYGIGICGTGIGIAIALNKMNGIYAANVVNQNGASLAKRHNDVNVITLSGRFISIEENIKIVYEFFTQNFEKGRHINRLNKIKKMEEHDV